MQQSAKAAAEQVILARKAVADLAKMGAEASVQAKALTGYTAAKEQFRLLMGTYQGVEAVLPAQIDDAQAIETAQALVDAVTYVAAPVTVAETDLYNYILGDASVAPAYTNIGVDALYNAFVDLLVVQGYYDPNDPTASKVNVKKLYDDKVQPNGTTGGGSTTTNPPVSGNEQQPLNSKYAIDGDIVLVTYGEPGQKFGEAGTKSFILNFNDYTVQTTLENGVTYTIEAYGYVVIVN